MLTFIKSKFIKTLLLSSLFALFLTPAVAQEKYILDPNHSYVLWSVDHFGFSRVNGKVFAEGSIVVNKDKPEISKIDVVIPIDKIHTGIAHLDNALASAGFFDTAQFPKAYFKSEKITITGENTAKIHGVLTIRNISKPIELTLKLNKQGPHAMHNNKKALGFTATGVIKRSDYGMNAYIPTVSDEVILDLQGEAIIEDEGKK